MPAGRRTVPLSHGGRERPYVLHVPPAALSGRPSLLLQLHGRGIDPVAFDRLTGIRALADEAGFVVAMPSAVGEIWNDGRFLSMARDGPDDVGYLLAVLDDAASRLPIDRDRIYAVGMSNGATMAGRLACEHAERLAGLAQVAGTASLDVAAGSVPAGPLPVIEIHGTGDEYAPFAGDVRAGLRARVFLRHPAGPSVGVDNWAALWAHVNGAHDGPQIETLPPDTTIRRWRGPTSASDVVTYRVEDGGHTWPGSSMSLPRFIFGRTSHAFSATRVIWDFLSVHARGS